MSIPGRKSDCFLRPVSAHTFVNAMKPQKMATCTFGFLTIIIFASIAKELCYWQLLFLNGKRFFFKTHRHERQYGEDEKAAPEDDVGDENDLHRKMRNTVFLWVKYFSATFAPVVILVSQGPQQHGEVSTRHHMAAFFAFFFHQTILRSQTFISKLCGH